MDLKVNLDLSQITSLGQDIKSLEGRLNEEIGRLAVMTHAHIVEEAQTKLHARRQMFLDNLAFQRDGNVWIITVKEPGLWIEEGQSPHSMVDDLLGKNPKIAKDGSKYRAIPFQHDKGPTQQTPAQQSLTATIKQELKRLKIPYKKIERDAQGNPKQGLLHSLDIMNAPTKTQEGPGQGHGAIGDVRQGNTGIPFLQGIRIYQRTLLNPDGTPKRSKSGAIKANRSIMTFRIVSSKHKGNKWEHPGNKRMGFLDEAQEWASRQWEQEIIPQILKDLGI